jgi:hypothetical protein
VGAISPAQDTCIRREEMDKSLWERMLPFPVVQMPSSGPLFIAIHHTLIYILLKWHTLNLKTLIKF